jgi:iron complex outermembrane receptor protein
MIYEPTSDFSYFMKYTHAFKSGQFNGSVLQTQQFADVRPVEGETVDSFETGFKSTWLEGRLELDATYFFYRYQDLQVFQLENATGALPAPQLVNANDAQVQGTEFRVALKPWDWVDVSVNFAWLDSEYLDFVDEVRESILVIGDVQTRVREADFSGNPLINSPEWSAAGYVSFNVPLLGLGTLVPRLDVSYRSQVYFDPNEGRGQFGTFPNGEPVPRGTIGQDDLWLLNLRLGWQSPDNKISVAGFVRNLTDEEYAIDAFDLSESLRSVIYVVGEPRIYGISVGFQF